MMLKLRTTSLFHLINSTVVTNGSDEKIELENSLEEILKLILSVKDRNKSVYVIGNGGSAGIASHFSIDLLNVLEISAHTLYDSNQLTCISNDYGYDQGFSRPLKIHLKEGDLLVAISSSGKSVNIINGAKIAKEKKAHLITLSGFSHANPLRKLGDYNLWLNAEDYGLVEMGHFSLLHTLIDTYALKYKTKEKDIQNPCKVFS